MCHDSLQWWWGAAGLAVLCLIGLMLWPSVVFADTFVVACAYIVVSAVPFIIAYRILRKLKTLVFWKFVVYLVIIVGTGLAFNSLLADLASRNWVFFAAVVLLLFTGLNVVLWRTVFAFTTRQSLVAGVTVGVINAMACIAATPICK